jgi:hypothetical protein
MKSKNLEVIVTFLIFCFYSASLFGFEPSQELQFSKNESLEARGLSVLLFHNYYPDGKQGGIEIIQHGLRIATNGDLRLEQLPQQWSAHPNFDKRVVNFEKGEAVVSLSFPNKHPGAGVADPGLKIGYKIRVVAEGYAFRIIVDLDSPLPKEWEGKVGFQMEFFPAAYFGKTFQFEKQFGIFPRQPDGPILNEDINIPIALPLGEGHKLILAPEDLDNKIKIESPSGLLSLYDGRNSCQNGWFIVRSILVSGVTKNAVEWKISPNIISNWVRKPVVTYSQVGYHPNQQKKAILEIDPNDHEVDKIILQKVQSDGDIQDVLEKTPEKWGRYLRYDYFTFDFSGVREEGTYILKYGNQTTGPFLISKSVYDQNVWQPTLEIFFPVQMCHIRVVDRYRVWHGLCHNDDALQAPPAPNHFDQYVMDSLTETSYKPFEHIPGLNVGGWHDAGDYDLPAGQSAIYFLALTQDEFKLTSDQTTIDEVNKYVELHKPDGKPDLLQQIEHGVLNLLTGYRISGHSFCGIIDGNLRQYVHLGDASTITDNFIFNPELGENEVKDGYSGKKDDRWAFTNKDAALEYRVANELAICARVLKGYNDKLADECIATSKKIWEFEQANPPKIHNSEYVPRNLKSEQLAASVELFISTKDEKYKNYIISNWKTIEDNFVALGWSVSRVLNDLNDKQFRADFDKVVLGYKNKSVENINNSPYGLPFNFQLWGAGDLYGFALRSYYFHKIYPELFDKENVFRVLNYSFGCHMANNTSMVSGVGAKSKTISYASNRADWSYIPGGVCSGPSFVLPDFPEFRDDFPFIWQQGEVTVGGSAHYLFLVQSAIKLLQD